MLEMTEENTKFWENGVCFKKEKGSISLEIRKNFIHIVAYNFKECERFKKLFSNHDNSINLV